MAASPILKVTKVSVLPSTFTPSTLYLVPDAQAGYLEAHVSDKEGTGVRRLPTRADIVSLISASLAGFNTALVVANIAARDALNPTVNTLVLVLDATADTTVVAGAATYVYDATATTWYKVSEAESLDLILDWSNILNKPTSTVAEIDDAVAKRHSHGNKTVLDAITDDTGTLLYNGVPVPTYLEAEDW